MKKILSHQEYQEFFDKLKKQIDSDWDEAKELNSKLNSIKNKNSIMIQQLINQNEWVMELKKETPQKIEKLISPKKEISVKDIRLDSLDNFELFFESEYWIKELKTLWIEIKPQEKIIDISWIKNPQYTYLWKTHASVAYAKLYKLIWEDLLNDVKVKKWWNHIYWKSEAKKVLNTFFAMLGYKVITWHIKPRLNLISLDDYLKYFESELWIEELNVLWVKINTIKKTYDLSEIKRPQSYNLWPTSASITLIKIRDLLDNNNLNIGKISWTKQIFKISTAQEILKIFFEKMGYKNQARKKKEVSEEEIPTIPKIQEGVKKSVQTKTQEQQWIKVHVDWKSWIVLTPSEAKNKANFN